MLHKIAARQVRRAERQVRRAEQQVRRAAMAALNLPLGGSRLLWKAWSNGKRTPLTESPGTLISHPDSEPTQIDVVAYSENELIEKPIDDLSELTELRSISSVLWVNVTGLANVDVIGELGDMFHLHRLALEDAVNIPQRPKAELFDEHQFITLRMVVMGEDTELTSEQISIFFNDDVLVTFQQQKDDCFDPVRDRMRHGRGRIRKLGPDYLAYALIDAILDSYLPVLEMYAEILDDIELVVMERAEQETISRIHNIRRDLTALRRPISPLRDAISLFLQEDMPYIDRETHVFLRDLHDHTVRAIDMIENYRELTGNLMDFHLSMMSHRMNEVMKMLTIISTIFIPLGFIAGLYGMNFNSEISPFNMPELGWYWGYPAIVGVMVTIAVGLLIYFRRKRWI